MSAKHTAGPWHRNIKPATHYNTIFAGRNTHVAHLAVQGKTEAEVEANCALIVAAPDLLIALRDLLEDAVALGICESNMSGSAVAASAAIAKATGGEA